MTPFLIGITGGSGSGKTTFIRRLRDGLDDSQVCYLSMDDYYGPREQQKKDDQGVYNFDRPKSINREEFARDLKRLVKGKTVKRQEYVFNNELAEPKILIFKPAPVIIVEGLFVFHYKEVRKMLDLRIFLHAKDYLKVIRRIQRDQSERNYPLDDVLY
ncbi:MAG: AAA family ATPase, partial [Bacteroidota bacterium]